MTLARIPCRDRTVPELLTDVAAAIDAGLEHALARYELQLRLAGEEEEDVVQSVREQHHEALREKHRLLRDIARELVAAGHPPRG